MPEPTYAMRLYDAKHIPSELLEPLYACLMSGWGMAVIGGTMSPSAFHERMIALGSLASQTAATHCTMATNSMISRFAQFLGRHGRSLDCTKKEKIDTDGGHAPTSGTEETSDE